MAGGIGRAQSAYDEMVFRAMVRDDAHFYSNLGLVSKGVAADFQTGTNAYLYGTRFYSYLAYVHSPQAVVEWLKRGEDSEALLREAVRQGIRQADSRPRGTSGSPGSTNSRPRTCNRCGSIPLTQGRRLTRQGLGSVSRSYYDPETNSLIGAFQYPGVVAYTGVVSLTDGSIRKLADIKGPMKYRVTSTAFDPATRTLFYSADNIAWRDLMAVDVASGKARMLLEDARIGDICFDESDRSLWGLRHLNGYVTLVRIPFPYAELDPGSYLALRRRALRARCVGRRLAALDVHRARLTARSPCAYSAVRTSRPARWNPSPSSNSARPSRKASCSLAMAVICTAAPTSPASPTFSATNSRLANSRRSATRKPASSARSRWQTAR